MHWYASRPRFEGNKNLWFTRVSGKYSYFCIGHNYKKKTACSVFVLFSYSRVNKKNMIYSSRKPSTT